MAEIELHLKTETLADATGLIHGLRVTHESKWGRLDLWMWLDRESGEMGELKPYRYGMLRER